ncbi:3790cf69-b5aa-4511-acc9-9bbec230b262 [Sclerotinia trifoliorum]|uniref:3790cf69-b5aa-4511-acc9-9bbec230b262 n=1 Tax=Sclerotinia trifoliorum TaxID=28548 RepID=A0A8H2VQN6_9HELO|nr:3790cf69-b5aa-4511-acc9-9bbec230b262 [Sclerotinia trifoliorum]
MSTPASKVEYSKRFPSWPEDSLSQRTDRVGSGSTWGIREIGTFQVLRRAPIYGIPLWLEEYKEEASARVEENECLQSVLRLFGTNWRNLTHEKLTRSAGPLSSFVKLLAQVLETPVAPGPQRVLRARTELQMPAPSNAPGPPPSPSSESSSSSAEYPSKRARTDQSPGYLPSDQSDQSTYDQQAKSEITANSCIYELCSAVIEISRKETDPPFRLEWTVTNDTITVQAASHKYSTKNDGTLVHKEHQDGTWRRVSNHSYCSIEAKSWHDTVEKPFGVQAQEAAHMIAMFSQRVPTDGHLQHNTIIPLVCGAQNLFSLVLGEFPIEYQQYLRDGSQSETPAFAEIREYGMFNLQRPDHLKVVFVLIIALNLKLQSLGPMS